jgi:hypothetical protein
VPDEKIEQEKREDDKTNEPQPASRYIKPENIADQYEISSQMQQQKKCSKDELVHQLALLIEDTEKLILVYRPLPLQHGTYFH